MRSEVWPRSWGPYQRPSQCQLPLHPTTSGLHPARDTQECPQVTEALNKWVGSWRRGCLVTWFCYQLTAKPGDKTAPPPWPDPSKGANCWPVSISTHWPLWDIRKILKIKHLHAIFAGNIWCIFSETMLQGMLRNSICLDFEKKSLDFAWCH